MPAKPAFLGPPGVPRTPAKIAWLALVTFGIYGIVWFYRFGLEIEAAGKFGIDVKRYYKQVGIVAAFIVTLPVALIHFFVYARRVTKAVDELAVRVGLTNTDLEDRFPILLIPFGGVSFLAMLQRAANQIWSKVPAAASRASEASVGGGATAASGASVPAVRKGP